MRIKTIAIVALAAMCCMVATAELQQVDVGGSIRIRGNYFNMDSLGKNSFIEQRTRLNVKADFTEEVYAFIEFDYYSMWGEDFRSNYLTGADFRTGTNNNDVNLYQGYIHVDNLWGAPLSLRVGRQEFRLGNAFFIGTQESSAFFTGMSYDAIRLMYAHDQFVINAVTAKTFERYGDFMEDDADLYGVYFSYIGIEDVSLDAYWLYARDRVGALGNDDDIHLHTLGLRGAGVVNGFDFEVEGAYQFGSVKGVPNPWFRLFNREADVDFDEFGVNVELGYTFDTAWQPRLFARFAYLGGGNPDRSWWSNDFDMPFVRLCSDLKYSEFFENDPRSLFKASMSNVLFYSLGVQVAPTEAIELKLVGAYLEVDQRAADLGRWFWRNRAAKSLGWEVGLYGDYHYSEDLTIRAGYAHFFGRRGLERNEILAIGLLPWGGDRNDDYDYLFIETEIKF
ncbi:MAG TPA: hypothetical protein ENN29_10550 [Candidatus Hydrogenedentes bacterium]|nr:hypothetical protein [Candidatus Hydrogenedentota bacterium]